MKKSLFWLMCGLVLALFVACDADLGDTTIASNENAAENTVDIPAGDEATVINILDGDTIDVELNGVKYRVRYIGVDTPERDTPLYNEATEFNRNLVEDQTVILVKDESDTDPYGRLLRYVYLPNGTFVNAEILWNGWGRHVVFEPDTAQQTYFAQLEAQAKKDQVGLWELDSSGVPLGGVCNCAKNAYDCGDFSTQTEAQSCFDYCMAEVGSDVHHLDGAGDGQVCESLP